MAEFKREYITVEVSDRNHHLCELVPGHKTRYISLVNGRSKTMVSSLCLKLNEQEAEK